MTSGIHKPIVLGEATVFIGPATTFKPKTAVVSMIDPANRIYLDWNATAPIAPGAREAAVEALCAGGNASSVHAEGRAARAMVETVRRTLADRFAVPADGVVFTSGGTEANATALAPRVTKGGVCAERLVVSSIEHPAVLSGGRFASDEISTIGVDEDGRIKLDALERNLAEDRTPALISVMAANNETGVIQPLSDIAAMAENAGAIFHTDAVQAFGRVDDGMLEADLITVSGHKIGAPMGVGALIRRPGVSVPPLIRGGGQERGARGGTENVAAVAGLGAALASPAANPAAWEETAAARDAFEESLKAALTGVVIFGERAPRLANTSLFSASKTPADLALIGLDLAGVSLSSGAACSSGKIGPSHVLAAMGVAPQTARAALRVSVGPEGAGDSLQRFLVAFTQTLVAMERHSIP
ncbi:MAG: cysteine desulfurase family protein [Pseudomonadota bacterium]